MKYVITVSRPENEAHVRMMHPTSMEMSTASVHFYPQKYGSAYGNEEGRSLMELNDGPWYVDGDESHARTIAAALANKHPGWTFAISELKIEYACRPRPVSSAKHTPDGVIPE